MPCTIPDDQLAYMDSDENHHKFGRRISTTQLLMEVACDATNLLEAKGLLRESSKLVQAWHKDHTERDEEVTKIQQRMKEQKEAEELKELDRLLKKYPSRKKADR
jgi:hypothetical protein